jgi:hypothetical protein
MTTITNKADFKRLLADEQAVLFVFFDWSGQAVVSLRLFELWIKEWLASHPEAPVNFYRLDPDAHPDTWTWLVGQARGETDNERGFGSVCWLRRGHSVGFVRYAAQVGKDELSRLTDEHFGATQPNNSPQH